MLKAIWSLTMLYTLTHIYTQCRLCDLNKLEKKTAILYSHNRYGSWIWFGVLVAWIDGLFCRRRRCCCIFDLDDWLIGLRFRGLYSKSNEIQTRSHANTRTNQLYHKSCSTECAEYRFRSSFSSFFFNLFLCSVNNYVHLDSRSFNEWIDCEANHCNGWSLCWIGANP